MIAKFTSGIWQIHPFCEGNTRSTAVFIIKYLKTFGFTYLLEELPKLKEFISDEEEAEAMQKLLSWSSDLPEIYHSRGRR